MGQTRDQKIKKYEEFFVGKLVQVTKYKNGDYVEETGIIERIHWVYVSKKAYTGYRFTIYIFESNERLTYPFWPSDIVSIIKGEIKESRGVSFL